jgi:polysaccharide export outer membrane protein
MNSENRGYRMKFILLALTLFLTDYAVAQPAPEDEAVKAISEMPEDFVIGLEDVLTVNVWKEPELSVSKIAVRPDGKIRLPLIGDIEADGLTPEQLENAVAEKFKEYVASPVVSVVVEQIKSLTVSIQGEVTTPGIYSLGSPITVLELLARAGGLTEWADTKNIAIIRTEGGKSKYYKFNYKDVSKGKNLQQNIVLQKGDIIIVP